MGGGGSAAGGGGDRVPGDRPPPPEGLCGLWSGEGGSHWQSTWEIKNLKDRQEGRTLVP